MISTRSYDFCMTAHPTVAIIGVGAMGEALRQGLERAGWAPDELSLAVRREDRAAELSSRTTSMVSLDPKEAIQGREVVVVAVKPRDVGGVVDRIATSLDAGQMILSLRGRRHD